QREQARQATPIFEGRGRRWNGGNEWNRAALVGWARALVFWGPFWVGGGYRRGDSVFGVVALCFFLRSEARGATSPRLCGRSPARDEREKRCRQEIRVPAPATWHRWLPSPNCVHPNRDAADGIRFPHAKRSAKT